MHDLDLPTYLVRARPIISTRTPYNEADVTDSGARSRRCSDPHAAADWDIDCTGIILQAHSRACIALQWAISSRYTTSCVFLHPPSLPPRSSFCLLYASSALKATKLREAAKVHHQILLAVLCLDSSQQVAERIV